MDSLFLWIHSWVDGQLAFDRLLILPLWQWGLFFNDIRCRFCLYTSDIYESNSSNWGSTDEFLSQFDILFLRIWNHLFFLQESFDFIHFVSFFVVDFGFDHNQTTK